MNLAKVTQLTKTEELSLSLNPLTSSSGCGNIISVCNSGKNGQSLKGYAAQSRELLGDDFVKCL